MTHLWEGDRNTRIPHSCAYRYAPPFLWGKSGHIQTFVFGAIGRFLAPEEDGERHSIIVPDGSTVYYDIFEPETLKHSDVVMFVCPGKYILVLVCLSDVL